MSIPVNPTGLTLTPGVNRMGVLWQPVPGAAGYRVYRSTDGINWSSPLVDTATTTFTDKRYSASWQYHWTFTTNLGLARNTRYYYRVTAYNVEGESAGALADATTLIDSPYDATGKVRVKMPVFLIVSNADYQPNSNPSKARVELVHDWFRANLTTKITLCITPDIITATSGESLLIKQYMQSLVTAYNYDIITLPHRAWFPTNPSWSAGIEQEKANMQTAHDACVATFGKYPVTSWGWGYNNDLTQKAVDLGYRLVQSQNCEQVGVDGSTSIGRPWQMYRPSKNNVMVPGNGNPANTFGIISGFGIMQMGEYYQTTNEPVMTGAHNDTNAFGLRDLFPSLLGQQEGIRNIFEVSQIASFAKYIWSPVYLDQNWLLLDSIWSTAEVTDGDRDQLYMMKQLALWVKDRYSGLIDFCTTTELADYLETVITDADPCPVHATRTSNPQEGYGTPDQQQTRYESVHYQVIVRDKPGLDGYIRFIQEIPYNVTLQEPAGLSSVWTVPGGVNRLSGTPARDITFRYAGTQYSLSSASGLYLREPNISCDSAAKTLTAIHDVYNATNTTRLLSLQITYSPSSVVIQYRVKDSAITELIEHNNVTGITQSIPLSGSIPDVPVIPPTAPIHPQRLNSSYGGPLRYKYGRKTYQIGFGGNGPVRIMTSQGIKVVL